MNHLEFLKMKINKRCHAFNCLWSTFVSMYHTCQASVSVVMFCCIFLLLLVVTTFTITIVQACPTCSPARLAVQPTPHAVNVFLWSSPRCVPIAQQQPNHRCAINTVPAESWAWGGHCVQCWLTWCHITVCILIHWLNIVFWIGKNM